MKFVLATKNKGKIEEFRKMFSHLNIEIISLDKYDIDDIEETGTTFEENSLIKAKAVSEYSNMPTIADDSGLCIEALDNKPGIYTARYFPECEEYICKCKKMIELLNETGSKNRNAKFVCVITVYYPNGETKVFRGESEGIILNELKGNLGHGYDPIFFSKDLKKSFAELTLEEKNTVSHRGKAFLKLKEYFKDLK